MNRKYNKGGGEENIGEEDRLTELYNAVCVTDHRSSIELIKNRPHLINRPCVNWKHGGYELPIAAAIRLKQNDVAYLLLSHGSQLETHESGESITALQWASAYGNVVLLEVLLKSGAEINHKGPNNNTALHYAVLYEQLDSVVCLLENGAEQVLNDFHLMPIHLACLHSVTPIVKQFLKLVKRPEDFLSEEYVRAFEIACVNGRIEVAKMWLSYFEMNYSDYLNKKKEFMERVNFFSVLKEWVDMFEGEEVGDGEGDFDEDYWRHHQILKLFLSLDIQWARPKIHTRKDDDHILQLFCRHPCTLLIKTFLIHCPLTKPTIPPYLFLGKATKHIRNDKALTDIFWGYGYYLDSFLTSNSASDNDFLPDTPTNNISSTETPMETINSTVNGIQGVNSSSKTTDESLDPKPLFTLQESCRMIIRRCIAGQRVSNISYKLPHTHLPSLLQNYLLFS